MSLYEDMPDVGTPSHKVKLDVSSAPPPPPPTEQATPAAVDESTTAAAAAAAQSTKFAFVPCDCFFFFYFFFFFFVFDIESFVSQHGAEAQATCRRHACADQCVCFACIILSLSFTFSL
jgi:hypothetical protein